MTATERTGKTTEVVRIDVQGEVNFQSAPELRARLHTLLAQRPSCLHVDLSKVPYMDSAGVAVLVEALQTQRRRGLRLELSGLQSRVRSLFEIARLQSLFNLPGAESVA